MVKHLFLSNDRLLRHETGEHPENAERLRGILDEFQKSAYKDALDLSVNRQATVDEIVKVHERGYAEHVLSLEGCDSSIDQETVVSPGSVEAAVLAAGLGLELVERVVNESVHNGFAIVRPPGHHARPSIGMGFCFFNNIAIAAKKALSMGVKRILILDWDVHHGNGTQEIFYDDDKVLLIDLHQTNLFPVSSGMINETGSGRGKGFTVNVPLPAGCVDNDYLFVFDKVVKPLALKFAPELILVSAGFDAHESDPLGFMNLTTGGYGLLTERIKSLAEKVCSGKLVFFLEGGYNTYFLAKNVLECAKMLVGSADTYFFEETVSASPAVEEIVREIHATQSK